ncbi:MAG TPA: hypothetical protein VNX26_11035 [Candidatus Acidoferrum sp.]|jgi:hypothetical protein|nr:hypothetical protein [Candidatus Acidoferrum sp.]
MSEKIRILYYALWVAHPVLQTVIAIAMFRRRQHREFKFFFAYVVFQIVTFAVVFPAYRYHSSWVFYLSWFSTAISVALGFKVIHEAFLDVFRPFHTLRDLGTVLFKWAGLVMLLVAGVVSVSTNSSDNVPWVQAIMTAQRCVRIIQVGMVLFLLSFARYLGVSRRQHSFGIALGFGSFAVVELALIASWAGDHLSNLSMSLINMAAYDATLLIWLGYTFAKSPARDAASTLLRPQRWEQSLSDIHHPLPADSLIPMFEGMVDRALSRTQSVPVPVPENGGATHASARATVVPMGGLTVSGLIDRVGSKR